MKAQTRLDRLTERARALAGEPWTVLYTVDGTEKTGSLDDMIADEGKFVRVIDGTSLHDLDRLLHLWDEAARAAAPEEPAERKNTK